MARRYFEGAIGAEKEPWAKQPAKLPMLPKHEPWVYVTADDLYTYAKGTSRATDAAKQFLFNNRDGHLALQILEPILAARYPGVDRPSLREPYPHAGDDATFETHARQVFPEGPAQLLLLLPPRAVPERRGEGRRRRHGPP